MLRTADNAGAYRFEVLGVADDFLEADGRDVLSYSQALAAALGRKVADPTKIKVTDALDEWAREKAQTASSDKQVSDYFNAAKRIVAPFGTKTLKTITAREIAAWMQGFIVEGKDPKKRRATANRQLATLKAALTRAADESEYQGVRAWDAAKKYPKAESFGARVVILSEEQERHLIEVAREDLRVFLTALQMTGARPGEIRQATVGDLHHDRLTITGKTGNRTIALSPEKAEWFAAQVSERPPDAPLLPRRDGNHWPDGGWLKPVRTAVKAAELDDEVTSYVYRHGFISRALSGGVPVAAVAIHCGTSVEMIMKSYAKFIPAQMQEWFG